MPYITRAVLVCLMGTLCLGHAAPAHAQFWRKWTGANTGGDEARDNRRANAEKHYRRAQKFEAEGKHAAAEAQYRAALKIDPDYTEARARLGVTRQHQGAVEEAIEIFEDIIEGEPRFSDAYELIVDALYVAGRFAEAWEHIHHAEDLGLSVPRSLRKKLAEKYPEPAHAADTTADADAKKSGGANTAGMDDASKRKVKGYRSKR